MAGRDDLGTRNVPAIDWLELFYLVTVDYDEFCVGDRVYALSHHDIQQCFVTNPQQLSK